jgi:hypothetical protein
MSFRRFIYYCALCGGWAAFGGWALGQALAPAGPMGRSTVFGLCLGLVLAFGLGLVDALWNLSWTRLGPLTARALTALGVGALGGACGGFFGFLLADATGLSLFVVIGWTITGVLIGAAIASYEVIVGLKRAETKRAALKKLGRCVLGGTVGGILGGILFLGLRAAFTRLFSGKTLPELWSPTSWGFVALGLLIGLLVGLAQVILKEAWIKVEAGFRPGREMILTKPSTSIGRAEGTDIPLFGDAGVDKLHANIILEGGRYYLEPVEASHAATLNDQPVHGRAPLQSGDLIRLGTRSLLRFSEKQKRK